MNYANIIRTLVIKRKILGITQQKLAELTGVNQPAISRIEKMKVEIRTDTLCKIANALGMSVVLVEKKNG